jgi:very-short-patch-repair endonuclease
VGELTHEAARNSDTPPRQDDEVSKDRRITRLARGQHGLVSKSQMIDAGISEGSIRSRLRTGRLEVMLPGVHRVGGVPSSDLQPYMAATLVERRVFVSGRSAAFVWGVPGTSAGPVEVTADRGARIRVKGVQCRETTSRWDVTRRFGIPVSGPRRVLVEVAADRQLLERAYDYFVDARKTSPAAVALLIDEQMGRGYPGTVEMRRLIERRTIDGQPTDSELETAFHLLLRQAGIDGFVLHQRLKLVGRSIIPDFVHNGSKVIVELDGYEFHRSRTSFEQDRARDARAAASGWLVLRFTWRQVTFEPATVIDMLRRVLARRHAS